MEVSGLSHRIDGDGVLRVVFDLPGERVNLLGPATLEELGRLADEAGRRDEHGNDLGLRGSFARAGGQTGQMVDVYFRFTLPE